MTLSAGSERAREVPRVALVTGGGKGLGAAIAARLAGDGFRVAILGRDRIALLVHNAGIAVSAALRDTTDEDWDRTMAVNVRSAFQLARAIVPEMKEGRWGRIVHVASTAGLTGYAYTAAYCASKHALIGLTRALAVELATTGITVNAVCPGFLETEMTERTIETIMAKTGRSRVEARQALEAQSPQKRLFRVDEVAHVVSMLCSADAGGINGQAISVCGGQVMR
jgi:3-hydroxybutyrate dehydrogenase